MILKSLFIITYRLPVDNSLRNGKPESRSLSVYTLHLKRRPHHFEYLLSDTHTKSGAFYISISVLLDPFKLREELLHILFFDTDAGILDLDDKIYDILLIHSFSKADGERDTTFFRVLYRISEDIGYGLLDTNLITVKSSGDILIKIEL